MASATFTLRAVDDTKAAFASVQNSLSRIAGFAKDTSKNFSTFFGFKAAIEGVRRLNEAMREAEKSGEQIGLTKEEVDNLTAATNLYDKAVQNVKITTGKFATFVASIFGKATSAVEANNIRLERAKPELDEIHEKLARQVVDNELIGASEAEVFKHLQDEVKALENKAKMTDDVVKKAQAELNVEVAKGAVRSAEHKFWDDRNTALEESINLRKELNAQIGIEPDIIKESNQLLAYRADISQMMRQIDTSSIEGEMQKNEIRKQRNKIDRELIPLLQQRYALERQIGQTVAESFQSAVLEGGKFRDVLRNLISEIIKMIFYENITRRLASTITRFILPNPLAGVISGSPIALPGDVPGFANGGQVSGGSPIVVGEKGPELFVPNSSGTIIPNGEMSGGSGVSGGPSFNFTYNIASGVGRAELASLLENERKRLKAEIPDMVRRGGSYRAAFA